MAMTKIDSQIDARIAWIRPILYRCSGLDIKDNELILRYLQSMHHGQYTRRDLMYIPVDAFVEVMLNMDICFIYLDGSEKYKTYSGEVSVIRNGDRFGIRNDERFEFNFVMDRVRYKFIRGEFARDPYLNHSNTIIQFSSPYDLTWCIQHVILKPYTIDY